MSNCGRVGVLVTSDATFSTRVDIGLQADVDDLNLPTPLAQLTRSSGKNNMRSNQMSLFFASATIITIIIIIIAMWYRKLSLAIINS